ncbi:MAG: hypothetical protein ACTSR2_08500 [Candidatus Hodarchaeales archaeon]
MPRSSTRKTEPIKVSSNVWNILLEIEALRAKEHKLIKTLWREIREDRTRRIHQLVFEQALSSNSPFPSVSKKELDKWIIENITSVIITLIEQGDIVVVEPDTGKTKQWLFNKLNKFSEIRKRMKKKETNES